MPEILECQRGLFDVPEEVAYLNCAYISPLLRAAREVGEAAVGRKSHPWQIQPEDFFGETEVVRGLFADLVGGDADGVAIIPSTTYGVAVAAANLALEPGQTILVLEEEFPSNVYPWRELAREAGAKVVTVPYPRDHDWTAAVLERIGEDTAVVAAPNCHWTDGGLVDLVAVGKRAREVGAALVVDAAQSLGALPLDVREVRPDFLISPTYKWLLGPYSLGFMWVAPEHREGKPVEHSWFNRKGSEDFQGLTKYRDDFQPGARRYDVGERSNPVLLPIAIVAFRQLLGWGVENVDATLRRLTAEIEGRAREFGFRVSPAEHRAGHLIGLRMEEGVPDNLAGKLAEASVFVSVRGSSIRVGPHLHNTPEDLDRMFEVLKKLMQDRTRRSATVGAFRRTTGGVTP
jgi:selenocysteine lyase/cysteine desulfurase